jgi:DNA-binding XRE family transcriptional regulator
MSDLAERLAKARKQAGYRTVTDAAAALGVSYPTYAGHENGSSGFRAATGEQYAKKFRVNFEWLMRGKGPMVTEAGSMVKLAGYVGAAQSVYQFDEDGAGWVEAPPGATAATEAVEVRGESMLPLYEDGTLLYYSRLLPPSEMIGRRCVVRLEDERVLVKTLRRGSEPGLYSLLSLNAPDIDDVGVQWAAPIDWIKPR